MADILQLPTIVWNGESNDPLTDSHAQLPAQFPRVAPTEMHSQSGDTFTRQFSSSPSPPVTEGELAAHATCESQILPHLDLDRLQPKPMAQRHYVRAMLSIVVVLVAAISAYLFGQRSLAGRQWTAEWLGASIEVGHVSGSRTRQKLSGGSENSGADVQSDNNRTDNNMSESAMPSSVAMSPQSNVQPDDAQRNIEGISTTLASAQGGTLPLQRAKADGAPDACGGNSGEGDLVPLPKPSRAEASAPNYDPSKFLLLAQIGRSWRPRMWLHWNWLNTPNRANRSRTGGEPAASARTMSATSHSTN
jgi:hypothetical protein